MVWSWWWADGSGCRNVSFSLSHTHTLSLWVLSLVSLKLCGHCPALSCCPRQQLSINYILRHRALLSPSLFFIYFLRQPFSGENFPKDHSNMDELLTKFAKFVYRCVKSWSNNCPCFNGYQRTSGNQFFIRDWETLNVLYCFPKVVESPSVVEIPTSKLFHTQREVKLWRHAWYRVPTFPLAEVLKM